jgi:hypothetical protein
VSISAPVLPIRPHRPSSPPPLPLPPIGAGAPAGSDDKKSLRRPNNPLPAPPAAPSSTPSVAPLISPREDEPSPLRQPLPHLQAQPPQHPAPLLQQTPALQLVPQPVSVVNDGDAYEKKPLPDLPTPPARPPPVPARPSDLTKLSDAAPSSGATPISSSAMALYLSSAHPKLVSRSFPACWKHPTCRPASPCFRHLLRQRQPQLRCPLRLVLRGQDRGPWHNPPSKKKQPL